MNHPSEKALGIAEELIDYVHPGMNRAAAIEEIATIVDGMNDELVEAAAALASEVERSGPGQHLELLNHLREVSLHYNHWQSEIGGQHDLVAATTRTSSSASQPR